MLQISSKSQSKILEQTLRIFSMNIIQPYRKKWLKKISNNKLDKHKLISDNNLDLKRGFPPKIVYLKNIIYKAVDIGK